MSPQEEGQQQPPENTAPASTQFAPEVPSAPPSAQQYQQERDQEEAQIDHLTEFAVNIVNYMESGDHNAAQANYLQAAKDHVAAMSAKAAGELVQPGQGSVSTAMSGEDQNSATILAAVTPQPLDPTPTRLRMVLVWQRAEGGANHNNPINVTAPLDRSFVWPGQSSTGGPFGDGFWNHLKDSSGVDRWGVCMFDTMDNGCKAAGSVLSQRNMTDIRNALASEDVGAFTRAFSIDPWGTDSSTIAALLGVQA